LSVSRTWGAMLELYRLDHRKVDETKVLDEWSYILATLLGPIYVLAHGFVALSFLMLLVSLLIAAIAAVALVSILLLVDSTGIRTVAIIFIPILAFLGQGIAGIEIVAHGYMRRGWRQGY
jgi:ABC-type multidrug transport system permease subunit